MLVCSSTSTSLDCFCSSITPENNTTRDHHNREARVLRRCSFCSTVSRNHICEIPSYTCSSPSSYPVHAAKRDPIRILAVFSPFLSLSWCIYSHLTIAEICFLFSFLKRLTSLATQSLLSAFIDACCFICQRMNWLSE